MTNTETAAISPAYDLLERFVRGEHVEDIEAASRQARAASERLSELRWEAQFAAMPPERQAEWERIVAGEHVPLPGDPEPSPCPAWCNEEAHLPERVGIDHVGASAVIPGALNIPGRPKGGASTYAYLDDGRSLVYVGDADLTPTAAREYAAAVVRSAELAERIETGA